MLWRGVDRVNVCTLRSITDEIPWSAECDYLGGVPDIPGPTPATVQLDVEGISVALRDWFLLCEADDIRRVISQQTRIDLHVRPDACLRLDCGDYYVAAALACLCS